ncbi:MAG TPA: hypothetical protein VFH63_10900 [candidate division Zixibacteria bacterium]|nr:hypothetical protein [candidate division Zixibacteria bacterium]
MSEERDDDLVPVSVRLGEVVPPEDPEDWTKPLTWVAAAGMLLGPLLAVAWFVVAPPATSTPIQPGSLLLAAGVAAGAALTGGTQQGWLRASTATLATALFAALVTVLVGAVMAGERPVGEAPPTLAHAFAAAVAGVCGAVAAAPPAAVLARLPRRAPRVLVPGAIGAGVAGLVVALLLGTAQAV